MYLVTVSYRDVHVPPHERFQTVYTDMDPVEYVAFCNILYPQQNYALLNFWENRVIEKNGIAVHSRDFMYNLKNEIK
jgi:hypothetical protein